MGIHVSSEAMGDINHIIGFGSNCEVNFVEKAFISDMIRGRKVA